MKKEWALLGFGLMLAASVTPVQADVLGRMTMERRYDQSGECHIPYREYRLDDTFGPILTPLHFTATGPTVTIMIEAPNFVDGQWLGNWIDKFLVLKRSVFENDALWKSGGCVTGAYFDFSVLGNDPSIVYRELFTTGPGGWSGVGTAGVYWENGTLALGHPNDPPTITSSVTVNNLVPGEEYTLSFWWHVGVPGSGFHPTLTATVLDTPQLSNHVLRNDSITGDAPLASWDYFFVDVPEGAAQLSVDLSGLDGDADLYVRRGGLPDAATNDCVSNAGGTFSENCTFLSPTPGRWWIGVTNFDPQTIAYTIKADLGGLGLSFYTLTPCRVLDTRTGAGEPLQSGFIDFAAIAGFCGVPSTAIAVSANLTVTSPTGAGHVKLWPGGTPEPPVSNINFGPGATRANNSILGLATDGFGDVAIKPIVVGDGTVHLIIDVNGYFQ